MVQVALKLTTRLDLNNLAIIYVKDKRHKHFHGSLVGVIESTLCDSLFSSLFFF